jgi:Flp pilus assembly protein TadD
MLTEMGRGVELTPLSELEQAQILFEAGDYIAVFDLLDPIAPGNPAVLRLLAQSEHYRQNWRNAAASLAQAIALSEPQPGEWATLAEYVFRTRRFASAERLCHLALAENNEDAEALNILGFLAMQRSDPEQAFIFLIRARLSNPTHTWAYENLTRLATALKLPLIEAMRQHSQHMIQQQQYTSAIEALSLLLELFSTDTEAYKLLAVTLNGLGRPNEALLAWKAAQQLAAQAL